MLRKGDSMEGKSNRGGPLVILGAPEQIKKFIAQHKNTYDANELVSSLAIEIWRLEKRIEKIRDLIMQKTDKNTNSVLDQLQRVKDIFKRQEIEVHDHMDEGYNDGMSVKALHVEVVDNLPSGEMRIIETVKPSVYFKGQIISHGEVIVGKGK